MIECQYCQATNDETDSRCSRCGRRLQFANARPAPEGYAPTDFGNSGDWGRAGAATAAALDPMVFETIEGGRGTPAEPIDPPALPPEYQPPLFREGAAASREGASTGKVVPIPMLTPVRREALETPRRRMPRNPAQPRSGRVDRNGRLDRQQDLFQGGEAESTPSNEVICCDAPVAVPAQRMMAACMDISLILVAAGVVLVVFLLLGGDMVFTRETVPFLLGVVAVLALFYRALWVIADGDTPGMRFAGLQLVDFDGRKPSRDARLLRQAAAILSVASLGLGLVWALVDEESLTWHDHISKTFPTVG